MSIVSILSVSPMKGRDIEPSRAVENPRAEHRAGTPAARSLGLQNS